MTSILSVRRDFSTTRFTRAQIMATVLSSCLDLANVICEIKKISKYPRRSLVRKKRSCFLWFTRNWWLIQLVIKPICLRCRTPYKSILRLPFFQFQQLAAAAAVSECVFFVYKIVGPPKMFLNMQLLIRQEICVAHRIITISCFDIRR